MMEGDSTNFSPFIIDFDKMLTYEELKDNGRTMRPDMFKKPDDFKRYWNSEHCYVTYLGGNEKSWMKVMHFDLDLKCKNPDTKKPQFPRGIASIIPISPDFSQETGVLIDVFLDFLINNGFWSLNDGSLTKMIKGTVNGPIGIDVTDKTLLKLFEFFNNISKELSMNTAFRMTSEQLYVKLTQITKYSVDSSEKIHDMFLINYFNGLKKNGFKRVKKKIRHLTSDLPNQTEDLVSDNHLSESKINQNLILV